MRHCLLITSYKDVENLNRIIIYTPVEWGVYVHLDKKSTIKIEDVDKRARVTKCYRVCWGGIEHLYAFLMLMKQAIRSGIRYDYFHLISGQDLYSVPPSFFDAIVGHEQRNYLGVFPLPNYNWGWEYGLAIFKYRTLSSYYDIRRQPVRFINSLCKYIQKMTRTYRRLPQYPLYGGSVYSSLTYDFAKYVLSSPMAKDLLMRLRNSTCAEEVFFQTLIMNSPFRKTVAEDINLRYVDWNTPPPRPKYLDMEDYSKILCSKSLFCRKVDSVLSASLIREMEHTILKL